MKAVAFIIPLRPQFMCFQDVEVALLALVAIPVVLMEPVVFRALLLVQPAAEWFVAVVLNVARIMYVEILARQLLRQAVLQRAVAA